MPKRKNFFVHSRNVQLPVSWVDTREIKDAYEAAVGHIRARAEEIVREELIFV